LSPSTSYTFKVRAQNSVGYGSYSGNSNSITTSAPPYMCISTSGATVTTCGNYKIAVWTGTGSFTVNSLGSSSGYGNHINYWGVGGGGGGNYYEGGGGGAQTPNSATWMGCLASSGIAVTAITYTAYIGSGGTGGNPAGNGIYSELKVGGCNFSGVYSQQGYGCRCGANHGGGNAAGGLGTYGSFNGGKCGALYAGGGGTGTVYRSCNGTGGTVTNNAPALPPIGSNYGAGNGGSGASMNFNGSSGVTLSGGGGGGGAFYAAGSLGYGSGINPNPYGNGGSYGGGIGAICSTTSGVGSVRRYPASGCANTGSGGGGTLFFTGFTNGGSGKIAIRWRFQ
jgi:hypothetical protein